MTLIEFTNFAELLKKEEGFLWLKSLEDTYISEHVDAFTSPPSYEEKPLSSTIFCLDVRSETMRRKVEESGPHSTYGAGGFLGSWAWQMERRASGQSPCFQQRRSHTSRNGQRRSIWVFTNASCGARSRTLPRMTGGSF